MTVRIARALVAAALMVATPQLGPAQTTGAMNGIVVDENGRAMAGLVVRVTSDVETERTRTDRNGSYAFVSLAPSTYALVLDDPRKRVRSERLSHIDVHAGRITRCDVVYLDPTRWSHVDGRRGNSVVPCDVLHAAR